MADFDEAFDAQPPNAIWRFTLTLHPPSLCPQVCLLEQLLQIGTLQAVYDKDWNAKAEFRDKHVIPFVKNGYLFSDQRVCPSTCTPPSFFFRACTIDTSDAHHYPIIACN